MKKGFSCLGYLREIFNKYSIKVKRPQHRSLKFDLFLPVLPVSRPMSRCMRLRCARTCHNCNTLSRDTPCNRASFDHKCSRPDTPPGHGRVGGIDNIFGPLLFVLLSYRILSYCVFGCYIRNNAPLLSDGFSFSLPSPTSIPVLFFFYVSRPRFDLFYHVYGLLFLGNDCIPPSFLLLNFLILCLNFF